MSTDRRLTNDRLRNAYSPALPPGSPVSASWARRRLGASGRALNYGGNAGAYEWGRVLHVRVVGFDYERSSRFAYFNLAYCLPLEYAIRHGFSHICLGPGTYDAKAGRGAKLDPTWSVIWPPDNENRAWFEREKRIGADAQEADRRLDTVSPFKEYLSISSRPS